MHKLLPYPFFVLFSTLALNITAFTVMLQMDFLMFNAPLLKVLAWLLTIGSWGLAYVYRNK